MIAALRMVRPLGERGQVVIPKDIRSRLNLKKGDSVAFEVHEDRVEIKSTAGADFLKDFFSLPRMKKSPSPRALKKIIMEQYDDLP